MPREIRPEPLAPLWASMLFGLSVSLCGTVVLVVLAPRSAGEAMSGAARADLAVVAFYAQLAFGPLVAWGHRDRLWRMIAVTALLAAMAGATWWMCLLNALLR